MINNKTLRTEYKAIRQAQKQSTSNSHWIIAGLFIIVGSATFALIVHGICLVIVAVHQLIK